MEWNFPSTNNGQIKGVADAGIETFQGDGIKALTRETCQNSLDAKREDADVVKMEVKQYYIDSTNIPGYVRYKKMLRDALKYWEGNSEKATAFLKKAIEYIEQKNTVVLRISDFNTCGLTEPYKLGFGSWNALTKIDGGATKSGDAIGSFGIGKNAPYVCSAYRMVFYRTYNQDGERASQGMSRLLSYQVGEESEFTTGTGYYGNLATNGPVEYIPQLEDLDERHEIGTDIFIYGLSIVNTSDIKAAVYVEILDNFLMSIYRNMLMLKFGSDELCSDTLEKYVGIYKSKIKDSYCTWLALTHENAEEFQRDFHGLGCLKLKVLVDHAEKLNRKILVTRKSGMKLFLMKNISKTISFTGVLELEGEELNKFFREMETPAHDKWKVENHSNPILAKEYLEELKEWVVDVVNGLGEQDYSDERDVTGLGSVLNINEDDEERNEKSEGLNNFLGEIEKIEVETASKTQGYYVPGRSDDASNKNPERQKEKGKISTEGSMDAIRVLKGTRKRKKIEQHKGFSRVDGEDIVSMQVARSREYPLADTRVMKLAPGQYRISYTLPANLKSGHVEVVTVGENGKKIKLNIIKAKSLKNCDEAIAVNGEIKFTGMKGHDKVLLEFHLPETGNYAMEVKVYEHN